MKQHTVFGRNLLMTMPKREHYVIDMAHSYHELMDGMSYPRKLAAHKIPYFAKVVSIVDAYDAITSSLCYDKGRASMEVLNIIYKGKRMSKKIVDLNIQDEGGEYSRITQKLTNGSYGV